MKTHMKAIGIVKLVSNHIITPGSVGRLTVMIIYFWHFSKKCYTNCKNNNNLTNIYSNYALGIWTGNCYNGIVPIKDNICLDCDGDIKKYRNRNGDCVNIPKQFLIVKIETELFKKCKEGIVH